MKMSRTPTVIPPYVDFEIRRGLRYAKATAKERILWIGRN